MKQIVYFIFFLMIGCNYSTTERVIFLENDQIRIGILPDVGGRLVSLSYLNDYNILKGDKNQWNESDDEKITPNPFSKFKAYNGFITWIGPQSQWWSNQNVNQILRDNKSVWPPDPYLIYGKFNIKEKTDTSITLSGPNSPISGVKLKKQYVIEGNKLTIKVTAKNISKKANSFDIWSNARFDEITDFIVPAANEEDLLKVTSNETELYNKLDYKIGDGYFYFLKEIPLEGEKPKVGKAFLHPQKGNIIAVRKKTFLLMNFDFIPKVQIHPNHGFIEIYHLLSRNKEECLLELEHHSAFKTLKPGESTTLTETWSLYEFNEPMDHRDYYRFYKEIIQNKKEHHKK